MYLSEDASANASLCCRLQRFRTNAQTSNVKLMSLTPEVLYGRYVQSFDCGGDSNGQVRRPFPRRSEPTLAKMKMHEGDGTE